VGRVRTGNVNRWLSLFYRDEGVGAVWRKQALIEDVDLRDGDEPRWTVDCRGVGRSRPVRTIRLVVEGVVAGAVAGEDDLSVETVREDSRLRVAVVLRGPGGHILFLAQRDQALPFRRSLCKSIIFGGQNTYLS